LLQALEPGRRPVPGPVQLAPDLRRPEPPRLDPRPAALVVAELVPVYFGDADPDRPRRFPADLLLLPQGLLPGFLGGPAGLCRRRAADELLGREPLAPPVSEHPPLLPVLRPGAHRAAGLGRLVRVLVARRPAGQPPPGRGPPARHGAGHGDPLRQRR